MRPKRWEAGVAEGKTVMEYWGVGEMYLYTVKYLRPPLDGRWSVEYSDPIRGLCILGVYGSATNAKRAAVRHRFKR